LRSCGGAEVHRRHRWHRSSHDQGRRIDARRAPGQRDLGPAAARPGRAGRSARGQHSPAEPRDVVHQAHWPRAARVRRRMRGLLHLLRSDFRRLMKTPSVPLLWLAFPIVLSVIEYGAFGSIGSNSSGMPKGTLLVVDRDRSTASNFLVGALERPPLSDFFDMTQLDTANVRLEKRLSDNEGS